MVSIRILAFKTTRKWCRQISNGWWGGMPISASECARMNLCIRTIRYWTKVCRLHKVVGSLRTKNCFFPDISDLHSGSWQWPASQAFLSLVFAPYQTFLNTYHGVIHCKSTLRVIRKLQLVRWHKSGNRNQGIQLGDLSEHWEGFPRLCNMSQR